MKATREVWLVVLLEAIGCDYRSVMNSIFFGVTGHGPEWVREATRDNTPVCSEVTLA